MHNIRTEPQLYTTSEQSPRYTQHQNRAPDIHNIRTEPQLSVFVADRQVYGHCGPDSETQVSIMDGWDPGSG